jgi:hypothetical protein
MAGEFLRRQGQSIPQGSKSFTRDIANRIPKVFDDVRNSLFNHRFGGECNQSDMGFEIVRERSIDEDFKDLLDGLDLQITKMNWDGGNTLLSWDVLDACSAAKLLGLW